MSYFILTLNGKFYFDLDQDKRVLPLEKSNMKSTLEKVITIPRGADIYFIWGDSEEKELFWNGFDIRKAEDCYFLLVYTSCDAYGIHHFPIFSSETAEFAEKL